MSAAPRPPAPSPAEAVRRFELALARRIDGLLHGDHAGRVPGLGTEAGESRRYAPGDDPRRIDWNVTARTRTPHVRDAVADRELTTWLVVDLSASVDFGTAGCTKRDLVVTAAGALAVLASRHGNRVGALLLTTGGVATLPPRSGHLHLMALLHRVLTAPRADGTGPDLSAALGRLARPPARPGLVVVVSDFPAAGTWVPALRVVAARHETLAVEVLDPRELDLVDVGMLVVVDPETGEQREVATGDAGLRRRYAALARERRTATAATLRGAGVDHLVLRTDRDATADLVGWLAGRPARVARMRRHRAVHPAGAVVGW
ncbi:MAG TPA: DUF58 domain-containing protein [Acidimicrobiales bacterium]|nr:DUF58 domain-containing protein [Acidimicrobiales bacterium]